MIKQIGLPLRGRPILLFETLRTGRLEDSRRQNDEKMSRKIGNAESRATFFRHSAVRSLPALLLRKVSVHSYDYRANWTSLRPITIMNCASPGPITITYYYYYYCYCYYYYYYYYYLYFFASYSVIIIVIIIIIIFIVADVFRAVVSLSRKGRSQATINLVLKFMIFFFVTLM